MNQRIRPLYSLCFSVLCQVIGFALGTQFASEGVLPLAVHGLSAFGLSILLRLPLPWQVLNLLLPAAIVLSLHGAAGTGIAIGFLLLTLLLYLPTYWTRIPWYPSHRSVDNALLSLLPPEGGFTFVDLGCGGATLLCRLARAAGRGRWVGYEVSPLALLVAFAKSALFGRGRVQIRAKSFWGADLNEFDLIYAFLSPEPMEALWQKVSAEARDGALLVTNTFAAPAPPSATLELQGKLQRTLYVYLPKAGGKGRVRPPG